MEYHMVTLSGTPHLFCFPREFWRATTSDWWLKNSGTRRRGQVASLQQVSQWSNYRIWKCRMPLGSDDALFTNVWQTTTV